MGSEKTEGGLKGRKGEERQAGMGVGRREERGGRWRRSGRRERTKRSREIK